MKTKGELNQEQFKLSEDPLAPTSIEPNEEETSPKRDNPNFSNYELLNRVENYIKLSKDPEASFKLQKMIDERKAEMREDEAKEANRNINLDKGIHAGIHPFETRSEIRIQTEEINAAKNDKTYHKMKDIYDENHSLKKEYGDINIASPSAIQHSFNKGKSKSKSRER